jgi:cytochrome c oxidase subunit IV
MTDTADTETTETPGTAVAVADEAPAGVIVPTGGEVEVADAYGHHPTPRQYVMIALVLVVLTAIEIAVSYIDTAHTNLIIIALFLMGAAKFFLVAGWYMHMRVDQPFFRRIFVVGLIGAGTVYGIVILVFSSTTLKG